MAQKRSPIAQSSTRSRLTGSTTSSWKDPYGPGERGRIAHIISMWVGGKALREIAEASFVDVERRKQKDDRVLPHDFPATNPWRLLGARAAAKPCRHRIRQTKLGAEGELSDVDQSQADTSTISASEAAQHIGQNATVEGVVTAVTTSGKGNTFINFGGVYPNQSEPDVHRMDSGWHPIGVNMRRGMRRVVNI